MRPLWLKRGATLAWETLARRARKVDLDLRDLFVFGGLGCVTYGIAQVFMPAAWIVCGVVLFWLGIRRV